ncbi:MAG: hypothetical protein GTO54_07730 [Nitrososphaeria archaeon]|nr:hypothetical protein [Nitrososphaeria archaeon]NIN52935.1 hypothetical protein [Nitrososphaeria archaeon]
MKHSGRITFLIFLLLIDILFFSVVKTNFPLVYQRILRTFSAIFPLVYAEGFAIIIGLILAITLSAVILYFIYKGIEEIQ